MQYWYISIDEDKVNINETTYYGTPKDNKRYLSQNFFKTKETAYEYAQKITNIFKENTKGVDQCFQMTYMETNKII